MMPCPSRRKIFKPTADRRSFDGGADRQPSWLQTGTRSAAATKSSMKAKEAALEKKFTDAFAHGFAEGLKKAQVAEPRHGWWQRWCILR